MKTPPSWSELLDATEPHTVEPVKRLRQGDETTQYMELDGERLAVRDTRPYGTLYGGDRRELMQVIDKGSDYTVFKVPFDTLSLTAITLGTGRHNTALLRHVYERIGQVVGRLVHELPVPLLGVADFAVVRPTADIVVTPPVHFGEGTYSLDAHIDALSTSVHTSFANTRNESEMLELSAMLGAGIRNALHG